MAHVGVLLAVYGDVCLYGLNDGIAVAKGIPAIAIYLPGDVVGGKATQEAVP